MRMWWGLVFLAVLPALAGAQSLGDAARKEAERRRKNREAGAKAPAFTDQNDPRPEGSPSPSTSPPPRPRPSALPGEAGRPEGSSEEAPAYRDESEPRAEQERYWRERRSKVLARRDEAKRSHDDALELVDADESYIDGRGRIVVRDMVELRQRLRRAKEEWDAAEKAIVDLEDEARRRGALPGWLR